MALYPNIYGFNGGMMQGQQTYSQMQQAQQNAQNNGITWVQGVEGAKAFQIAPNSNILLMDSENNGRFYIKTCDNVGMCTLRYFDYSEVTNAPTKSEIDTSQFVTKEELNGILTELKEGMKHEQSVSTTKSNQQFNTNQRASTDYKH